MKRQRNNSQMQEKEESPEKIPTEDGGKQFIRHRVQSNDYMNAQRT